MGERKHITLIHFDEKIFFFWGTFLFFGDIFSFISSNVLKYM
jgi:hypothetical protein